MQILIHLLSILLLYGTIDQGRIYMVLNFQTVKYKQNLKQRWTVKKEKRGLASKRKKRKEKGLSCIMCSFDVNMTEQELG